MSLFLIKDFRLLNEHIGKKTLCSSAVNIVVFKIFFFINLNTEITKKGGLV